MKRLAVAAGYTDGLPELGLETMLRPETIIEAVSRSLMNIDSPSAEQIREIAVIAAEERLRHSQNDWDRWTAKNTLKLEVPAQ